MSGSPARRKTSSLNASLLSEAPILPASYCFDGPLSLSSARSPDMGHWSVRLLSNPPCCMTGPVNFCLAYKLFAVSTTVPHKRFIAIACESCSQSSDAMCCLLLWLCRSQGSFSASAFRDGLLVYRHPLAEPLPFSRTASFFERHHLTYRVTIMSRLLDNDQNSHPRASRGCTHAREHFGMTHCHLYGHSLFAIGPNHLSQTDSQ